MMASLTLRRRALAAAAGASGLAFVVRRPEPSSLEEESPSDSPPAAPPLPKKKTAPKGSFGVLPEYEKKRLWPREVVALDDSAQFFGKELDVLGLPLRAHRSVTDGALLVAADRLSRMLRHMPEAIFERLSRVGLWRSNSLTFASLNQRYSALC